VTRILCPWLNSVSGLSGVFGVFGVSGVSGVSNLFLLSWFKYFIYKIVFWCRPQQHYGHQPPTPTDTTMFLFIVYLFWGCVLFLSCFTIHWFFFSFTSSQVETRPYRANWRWPALSGVVVRKEATEKRRACC
jgi:hypothetical protein